MHKLNFTSFALLALEMQTQHHFAVTSRKLSSPERLLYLEAVNVTKKEIFINLGIKFIYMRSLFKPLICIKILYLPLDWQNNIRSVILCATVN